MSIPRRLGYRVVDFFTDYFSLLLQAAATVWLSAIDKPTLGKYRDMKFTSAEFSFAPFIEDLWFWAPALLFIFATILVARRTYKVNHLHDQITVMEKAIRSIHSEFKEAWDVTLKTLNDNFSLAHEERISVYKHEQGKFVLYHRYSDNPTLKKPGRPFYPETEGCIGKAWHEGKCEEDSLSDPSMAAGLRQYKREQSDKFGISADVVDGFKMLPRSYAAYAIFDLNKRDKVAVIVFESLAPNKFATLNLHDRMKKETGQNLAILMSAWRNVAPSLEFSKKLGY